MSRDLRPVESSGTTERTDLAILCALDAILRDSATTGLLLDSPGTVALRYDIDADNDGLRRLTLDSTGVIEDVAVHLEHACISCALREDALPVLRHLAADPRWDSILFVLPISADPVVAARAVNAQLSCVRLTCVAAIIDTDTAREDLLGDDTLAERGLRWAEGDERSVGEALTAQIEYADLIVAAGDEGTPGEELVEHLRSHDQLMLRGIESLTPTLLLDADHDGDTAQRRIDPRRVEPWGGPTVHGTWTLDLMSERPFHPDRLMRNIEMLGTGALRARGRFWLPTRPSSVCQWDGAGGQLSIGSVADWGSEEPTTRLVITGIDPADRERIMRAFAICLLDEREWKAGLLPWLGREDDFAPWLGERSAAA